MLIEKLELFPKNHSQDSHKARSHVITSLDEAIYCADSSTVYSTVCTIT